MELLMVLPHVYIVSVIFFLGLIMGSFLDVIVCRFHTGKSINGRSRCMSCGHTLSWYELFPLVSYLILRGKCKSCDAFIPVRLLLMELCTALVFLFVYLYATTFFFFAFGLVLTCLLIVIASYDMRHMVIPNEFVMSVALCATVFILYEAYVLQTVSQLIGHGIAGIGASLFFLTLWLVSKGKWIGFGDVKLALPLGGMLSISGAFSFVVFSFWIGAVLSILLLLTQKVLVRGQKHLPFLPIPLTMKSEVPFAPFMLIAFMIVFFAHADVLSLMASFFLYGSSLF